MKHMKRAFTLGVFAAALLACLQTAALGQTNDGNIANMSGGGSGVRWDILVSHAGGTLTITFPDGRAIRKSFRAGAAPDISLGERQLENLPDGVYSYELTLSPVLSAAQREALAKARGNDDDPENERMLRKRPVPTLNKSGSFAILNGSFVIPGAVEGQSTGKTGAVPQTPRQAPTRASANTVTRLRNHRFSLGMPFDFVIADDTIIQGSACVGLDCVNGEVFGFDTIRLKENNTRIQFDDTSAAGFPTNNWQIRANSSAAGGASFLAFVDQGSTGNSETGTIVFEVDAGAPANSLKVSSSGKVGIRTATPVLDVHVNASDTPAFRMEQNSSGGFTAQTWDIGANEANWFVRDVTGGSRLPLRIRPGAPTSSVDISAAGNVGIGNTSPTDKLEVKDGSVATYHANSSVGAGFLIDFFTDTTGSNKNTIGNIGVVQSAASVRSGDFVVNLSSAGAPTEKLRLNKDGNLGIGTNAPDQKLSVQGDADKSAGGTSWGVFSDERLKDIKGAYSRGLSAVMGLRPVRFSYKKDNALALQSESEIIGFSAQALQKLVPEAVSKNANGYLVVHSDPILWSMLNAIQEQQKEIEQLKGQIRKLKTTSHRRHR